MQPVKDMILDDVLGQKLLAIDAEYQKLKPHVEVALRRMRQPLPAPGVDVSQPPPALGDDVSQPHPPHGVDVFPPLPPHSVDVFQPPADLATPAPDLLALLGQCPACCCYPFTPANCFRLAKDCYRLGLYADTIALLRHAVARDGQASYYYLKAYVELQAGLCHDAVASVQEMLAASAAGRTEGLEITKELYNGPVRGYVDDLAKFISTGR
jgi:hypothetical protein